MYCINLMFNKAIYNNINNIISGGTIMYKHNYEELLIKDDNGNIILEQHSDGFREESVYVNNKLVRQVTRFSNGIVETNNYSYPKEI